MQKLKAPLARCLDIIHFVIICACNYLSTTSAVPISAADAQCSKTVLGISLHHFVNQGD